ncbi:MAG: TetR/AcrR family transcriptional regulator [Roseinatronobacter sp.]|nr:TetR/AcrR family transcriptional regulator [Roseinatronobacter sp.]
MQITPQIADMVEETPVFELTTEGLCRSILARHQDTICVRKTAIAVPRLKRILESALDLSNRGGFQAMSLRDLSRASGMSTGGLYAYFDSKTTLRKMSLQEVTDLVQRVLGKPPAAIAADPVAHLRWLIDTHLHLTEALLPWFTFAFMEAKNFPPAERRIAVDSEALTERLFAEVIERGVMSGVFRTDTSPMLPALIKPLLQEWYVKRPKYRRRGISLVSYSATVQDFVLNACLKDTVSGRE